MLKRYSEYSGCNTTISCIAKESPDGEWVRFDDLIKLIGYNDTQKTEYNSDKTICPDCGGMGHWCNGLGLHECETCEGTGHIVL